MKHYHIYLLLLSLSLSTLLLLLLLLLLLVVVVVLDSKSFHENLIDRFQGFSGIRKAFIVSLF